jgi:hypothetical protein
MSQSFPVVVENLRQLFCRYILNRRHKLLAFLWFGELSDCQTGLRMTVGRAFSLAQSDQESQEQ